MNKGKPAKPAEEAQECECRLTCKRCKRTFVILASASDALTRSYFCPYCGKANEAKHESS